MSYYFQRKLIVSLAYWGQVYQQLGRFCRKRHCDLDPVDVISDLLQQWQVHLPLGGATSCDRNVWCVIVIEKLVRIYFSAMNFLCVAFVIYAPMYCI